MATKTTNVPSQTYAAGQHVAGPFDKPANTALVSIQLAAATDWQTGTPGRTVDYKVQFSADGGTTWLDRAETTIVSPQMGKAGALPTVLEVDISADPATTVYQIIHTYSAPVTTGYTVTRA